MTLQLDIRLFVSHSFTDHDHILDVEMFRAEVNDACSVTNEELSKRYSLSVCVIPYFEDAGLGKVLPSQIRNEIINSDIFMIDIAGATPNTFYELGYAHAHDRGLILLEAVRSGQEPKLIPSDISDLLVGRYKTSDDLNINLVFRLKEISEDIIRSYRRALVRGDERCFWFHGDSSEIHIICAPEPERTRFADTNSSDYLFVDNLDDRDALFEVSNFLSRSFPNAKIFRHSSGELSADVLNSNIVVLGGPHNNSTTRDLMAVVNTSFTYVDEEKKLNLRLNIDTVSLSYECKGEDNLVQDVGYFGWFLNPFNRNNRVVMCHGWHTFGTLGASLAFADNNLAVENIATLKEASLNSLSEIERIECIFRVTILENRRVVTPKIDKKYLLLI